TRLLGEHDDEQKRDNDGAGINDNGGRHQEWRRQQQEQPARAQHHQGKRQRRMHRIVLGQQQAATQNRQSGKCVEQDGFRQNGIVFDQEPAGGKQSRTAQRRSQHSILPIQTRQQQVDARKAQSGGQDGGPVLP